MLTKYERELVDYWTNWKPGMPPFVKSPEDYDEEKKKVKHTKKEKAWTRLDIIRCSCMDVDASYDNFILHICMAFNSDGWYLVIL